MIKNLGKHIKEWVQQGFITEEQASNISHHEKGEPIPRHQQWMTTGFLSLGLLVLGIGVISLIAANWQQITNDIKLTVSFTLLVVSALFVYLNYDSPRKLLGESLIFFYMLFCFASLSLITDMYHFNRVTYTTISTWSFIILPLVLFSRYSLIPTLWAIAFVLAGSMSFINWLSDTNFYNYNEAWFTVVMLTPLACALIASLLYKWNKAPIFARAFYALTMLTGLSAVTIADLTFNHVYEISRITIIVPSLVITAMIVAIIFAEQRLTLLQKILIKLILLFYMAMYILAMLLNQIHILGAVFSILLLSITAIYFGSQKQRKLFYLFTSLVGIRFALVAFNIFYSISMISIGLIISGALIIIMVFLWQQNRKTLLHWMEGLNR